MKIELVSDARDFGELDAGDVFLHDDDMCLKLDVEPNAKRNAVDLEDGGMRQFKDGESVIFFPDATLCVEAGEDDDDDDDD